MLLTATDVRKGFDGLGVLKGISLSVQKGDVVALIGPSGSGKSTFLRCLNQLETVDAGRIQLDDIVMCDTRNGRVTYAPESQLRQITLRMGMVFQQFHLFPHRSVLQNVVDAPMRVKKLPRAQAVEKGRALLDKVGLLGKAGQYPYQLSGGQQQRVAIGRALITKPALILADEPTGNLDSKSSSDVMNLLLQASRHYRQTILMITHNINLTSSVDRVLRVSDGILTDLGGNSDEKLS